jgi:hypothetical protein
LGLVIVLFGVFVSFFPLTSSFTTAQVRNGLKAKESRIEMEAQLPKKDEV